MTSIAPAQTNNNPLPHSNPTEQALLGTMLLRGIDSDTLATLTPQHFFKPAHSTIYQAILDLAENNSPISTTTVGTKLTNDGALNQVGGYVYLTDLVDKADPGSVAFHCGIVIDYARRRSLQVLGGRAAAAAQDGSGYNTETALATVMDDLLAIQDAGAEKKQLVTPDAYIQNVLDSFEGSNDALKPICHWGLAALDSDLIVGMCKKRFILVAGRPGDGKSALALQTACYNAVKKFFPVLYISLEMSREELLARGIANLAKVDQGHIATNELTNEEWSRVGLLTAELASAPLYIIDDADITMAQIEQYVRRIKNKHGVSPLIIVDYIQRMKPSGKHDSEQAEISWLSWQMKRLAMIYDTVVIGVSQLNRQNTQRADKRPQISDLRGTGSLEQDADVIILINREEQYDHDTVRVGEADLIIGKHRGGRVGSVVVQAQMHYARFVDKTHCNAPF